MLTGRICLLYLEAFILFSLAAYFYYLKAKSLSSSTSYQVKTVSSARCDFWMRELILQRSILCAGWLLYWLSHYSNYSVKPLSDILHVLF